MRSQSSHEPQPDIDQQSDNSLLHVSPSDSLYPSRLKERNRILPRLYYWGNVELFASATSVAIAGSRNASNEALKFARNVAARLAERGASIVSGYARGIDREANIGALDHGGTTIAVLATGIQEFSLRPLSTVLAPPDLRNRMLAISQFHPNAIWRARQAMERNATICALADAIVIVESGPERDLHGKWSGTFQAARSAFEMKIPVFVLDPAAVSAKAEGNGVLLGMQDQYHDIFLLPSSSNAAAELIWDTTISSSEKNGRLELKGSRTRHDRQLSLFPDSGAFDI